MAIAVRSRNRLREEDEDFYPVSDGKPMAETDTHRDDMLDCIAVLGNYFGHNPQVYVSGNNFLYWERGNRRAVVSPDCYVVFGVEKRKRDCYKVWEEGAITPAVAIELTSRKTRRIDIGRKRDIYEQALGVTEYFLFDPQGDYLKPPLQGFRLWEGRYVPLELRDGRLYSEQLGLFLVGEGDRLRFYDPNRGVFLQTPDEQAQALEDTQKRLADTESELARLRAELEALRHPTEQP